MRIRINLKQRAGKSMQTCVSLSVKTSAIHIDKNVKFILITCNEKRLMHSTHLLLGIKILRDILSVYNNFAAALTEKHTCNSCFSSACTNCNILNHHRLLLHFKRLWILSLLRVFRTCVNLNTIHHLASKTAVRKHSSNCARKRLCRISFNKL